jgi:proteic killer suppression protein
MSRSVQAGLWEAAHVIRSFADKGTEDIYNGVDSKAARKTCPSLLGGSVRRKLDRLYDTTRLSDLALPPGNKLEGLKRDRLGQHAIRINGQYRICFRWTEAAVEDVEMTDYH